MESLESVLPPMEVQQLAQQAQKEHSSPDAGVAASEHPSTPAAAEGENAGAPTADVADVSAKFAKAKRGTRGRSRNPRQPRYEMVALGGSVEVI